MTTAKNISRLPNGFDFHYLIEPEMQFIYQEIFSQNCYSHKLISYGNNETVIDIGGNIGLFLLFLCQQAETGRVFSYEPIPDIFRVHQQNVELLQKKFPWDFQPRNCGVSHCVGEATFTYLPQCTARSSIYKEGSPADDTEEGRIREKRFTLQCFQHMPDRWTSKLLLWLPNFIRERITRNVMKLHAQSQEIKCQLTTISQIIEDEQLETIDLLKVDAEGSEWDILQGVEAMDWPKIRQLAVELHPGPGDSTNRVPRLLLEHGYQIEVEQNPFFTDNPIVFASRSK